MGPIGLRIWSHTPTLTRAMPSEKNFQKFLKPSRSPGEGYSEVRKVGLLGLSGRHRVRASPLASLNTFSGSQLATQGRDRLQADFLSTVLPAKYPHEYDGNCTRY